uniref:Uncharacterized protein n=1 Tax=Anguilla anguilla TaxID=7936 RepID=A0A0E9SYF5_ANGAN
MSCFKRVATQNTKLPFKKCRNRALQLSSFL